MLSAKKANFKQNIEYAVLAVCEKNLIYANKIMLILNNFKKYDFAACKRYYFKEKYFLQSARDVEL